LQRRHADFARADEHDAHRVLMKQRLCARAPRTPPRHRLGHQFVAGSDFTLADRRSAASAQIIEDLAVRQD